jgi:hypothetical protein
MEVRAKGGRGALNKPTQPRAAEELGGAQAARSPCRPSPLGWPPPRRRLSPRLRGRPEKTDFIGCLPFWSLRCQQQKNTMVAMVPSSSSRRKRAHWML